MPRGRRYSLRAARMRHTLGGRPPRPDRRRRPDGQTMQLYYPGARLVRFDKPAGVGYTACDYKRDSGQRVPAGAYCGGRPRGRSAADRRHPMNADGAGGVAYGVVLGWPMAWFWGGLWRGSGWMPAHDRQTCGQNGVTDAVLTGGHRRRG